jgi:hypothetical protein
LRLLHVFASLLIFCTSSAYAGDANSSNPTKFLIDQKNTQIKDLRDIRRKNILKINELESCAKSNAEECKELNATYGFTGDCDRSCGLQENEGSCKPTDYIALMATPRDLTDSKLQKCVLLYRQAKNAGDEIYDVVSKECGQAINNCSVNKRSKKVEEIQAHNESLKKEIDDYQGEITQLIRQQQEIVKRVKNVVKQEQAAAECTNCQRSETQEKIIKGINEAFPGIFEPETPKRKPAATKGL